MLDIELIVEGEEVSKLDPLELDTDDNREPVDTELWVVDAND